MKKTPRKTKQWAKEAWDALQDAWVLLVREHPDPSEAEKLELLTFAPAIAAMNRGIRDAKAVESASAYVFKGAIEDLRNKDEGEPVHYSIMFLLAYLDSTVAYGVMTEHKAGEVMEHLAQNFAIDYEP